MPSYISPEGHRKIVEEYNWLLKVERPRITAEVTYAASLGDRSDNAEYRFGKQRLREIDRRLGYLGKRLDGIEVVDSSKFTGDTVLFGATVAFEDEEGGTQVWTILGEDEVDTEKRRISYVSPLGRALLGKKAGDAVEFDTPKGRRDVTILSVTYPRG
ncbi:MAG: transcription elongation factor GreB [Pseudomonadota bacterium]|nr:transcription elongation factor GreB [Pseudomonadota bacterium]